MGGVAGSGREDLDEFREHLLQFDRDDRSCPIEDDTALGGKESIGANMAGLPQATTGKVAIRE